MFLRAAPAYLFTPITPSLHWKFILYPKNKKCQTFFVASKYYNLDFAYIWISSIRSLYGYPRASTMVTLKRLKNNLEELTSHGGDFSQRGRFSNVAIVLQ